MALAGTAALAAGAVAAALLLGGDGAAEDPPAEAPAAPEAAPEPAPEAASTPERAADPLEAAWEDLGRGRTEAAYAAFQAAASARPDDPAPRRGLLLVGVLWMDPATVESAAADLERLAPGSPDADAAAAARAVLAGEVGAADRARALVAADPEAVLPQVILARALMAEGEPCGALAAAGDALRLRPGMWEAEMIRLAAIQAIGDPEAELERIAEIHRTFPDRPEPLDWLLGIHEARGDTAAVAALLREEALAKRDDPAPVLRLVEHLRRTGGDEAVLAELEALAPAFDGTPVEAEIRVQAALAELRQGEVAQAMEALSALAADPEVPVEAVHRAQVAIAEAQEARGDPEAALALLDSVLAEEPGQVEALALKGRILLDEDRAVEALDAIRVARDQEPLDTALMLLEARAHEAEGRDALAGDLLARAVETSDGGAAERRALAAFLRARGRDAAAEAVMSREEFEAGSDAADEAPAAVEPSAAPEEGGSSEGGGGVRSCPT